MAHCSASKQVCTVQGAAGGTNTAAPDHGGNTVNQDREAYALAAGWAFGMINLGRGQAAAGSAAGGALESLRRLILGGAWGATEAYMACCLSLPLHANIC